jgi:hypothetical protein
VGKKVLESDTRVRVGRQIVGVGFGGNKWPVYKGGFHSIGEGRWGLFTVNRARVEDSVVTASASGPGPCPECFRELIRGFFNIEYFHLLGYKPFSPYVNRRFGVTHNLHLQDRESADQGIRARSRWQHSACPPTARWFHVRLFLGTADGGNVFGLNIGSRTEYPELYPRRRNIHNYLYENLRSFSLNIFRF